MTFEELAEVVPSAKRDEWEQHPNGGGWVHKLAVVHPSCHIGEGCTVRERCTIGDGCTVRERCDIGAGCDIGMECSIGTGCYIGTGCRIGGECTVGERCHIEAGCTVGERCHIGAKCHIGEGCTIGDGCIIRAGCRLDVSPLCILGTMHGVNVSGPRTLRIGCIDKPIEWWKEHHVWAGEEHGYTPEQIEEYRLYIDVAEKWINVHAISVTTRDDERKERQNDI